MNIGDFGIQWDRLLDGATVATLLGMLVVLVLWAMGAVKSRLQQRRDVAMAKRLRRRLWAETRSEVHDRVASWRQDRQQRDSTARRARIRIARDSEKGNGI